MLAGGAYQVTSLGVFIYSFDNKSWDKVTTFGYGAIWLNDSRSLLFTDDRGYYQSHQQARTPIEVSCAAPGRMGTGLVAR